MRHGGVRLGVTRREIGWQEFIEAGRNFGMDPMESDSEEVR
jgi:hypothetical protein